MRETLLAAAAIVTSCSPASTGQRRPMQSWPVSYSGSFFIGDREPHKYLATMMFVRFTQHRQNMRFLVLALGLISWSYSNAHAQAVIAKCSLVVDGSEVWNGKCCVTAEATPSDMTASLHAESWQACLYGKRHPENARLPTYRQKCLGPWINIFQESEQNAKGNNYSAYWSIEGACHGGESYPAKRTGNVYQGDKFIFEWHEIQ